MQASILLTEFLTLAAVVAIACAPALVQTLRQR